MIKITLLSLFLLVFIGISGVNSVVLHVVCVQLIFADLY